MSLINTSDASKQRWNQTLGGRHLQSGLDEQIDLKADLKMCDVCVIPTNHSFSSSFMEGPGQRESLNKMLLLQQAVDSLYMDRDKGEHESGAKRAVTYTK